MNVIKGVSRRIIEINRPESPYFERAVLYLRPEMSDAPLRTAQLAAERYLGEVSPKQHHFCLRGWAWFALGMAVSGSGTALAFLLNH